MKKKILFGGIALLVLIIGAVSAMFLLKGDDSGGEVQAEEMPPEAYYQDLHPAFVVNFAQPSEQKFMQVYVVTMSHDTEVIKLLEMHTPAVRNAILLHLGSKTSEQVSTSEGKELLRAELVEVINKVMMERAGSGGIEDILFTKFVMQ